MGLTELIKSKFILYSAKSIIVCGASQHTVIKVYAIRRMLPTGNIKKYMYLHNYLKLPISHKRGMEITCCSIMSHYFINISINIPRLLRACKFILHK